MERLQNVSEASEAVQKVTQKALQAVADSPQKAKAVEAGKGCVRGGRGQGFYSTASFHES